MLVEIGGFFGEVKALRLANKLYFLCGFPKVELTGDTPRNITQKIERPQRGISRPIYGQMFDVIFNMLVDTPFCLLFSHFYRSNPFESLADNDATGGPHLFRPTRDILRQTNSAKRMPH
jgi:hypothetical protein